jgi:hypothetical protein
MTVYELLSDIHSYYLPAIQREFVWPPEKIEALFDSILRGYPIGTLLRWDVREPAVHEFQFYELIRNYDVRQPHNVKANLSTRTQCYGILDGQQRVTALYIGLQGSHTEKIRGLWWKSAHAFPRKVLYMNLLHERNRDDSEQQFQIRFLTEQQATKAPGYWFRVGEIVKYRERRDLRDFIRSTEHWGNSTFEDNVHDLWAAIHEQQTISYFSEVRQDLDEVLRIFVRLNTGGTPLSYSDLLLSLATATWKGQDAREEVYGLVEHLNKECGEFYIGKDLVLKALLVLNEGDVRFRAVNISKKASLETIWEPAKASLKTTVKLARSFGLNWQTLTAHNALIPIAYYIYKRNLTDSFLTQKQYEPDREVIRVWLLKMLLGQVFGGQSDQILTLVRETIKAALVHDGANNGFPADEILQELSTRRAFAFSDERVDALISDTRFGDRQAYPLLALIFPYIDYHYSHFHIDHMHPASHFTKQRLQSEGMSSEDVQFALDHYNDLPNLQLLTDPDNLAKTNKPFAEWLGKHPNPTMMRSISLVPDVDLSLRNFRGFYEARKQLLIAALKEKLGTQLSQAAGIPLEQDEPIGSTEEPIEVV